MIERLESRTLRTATYAPDGQWLRVTGTEAVDVVVVTRVGDEVVVSENGTRTSFPAADVQRLQIATLGGNDRIYVRTNFPAEVMLFGGPGRNLIVGSDGDDRLYGGGRLLGRGGNDYLEGGGARDVLLGGPGNDEFLDIVGPDVIHGGPGADTAFVSDRSARGVRAESVSFALFPWSEGSSDPTVRLTASRSPDGVVSVLAEASHPYGGWQRVFADPVRTGNRFAVQITGVGPGGTTTSIETDTHAYALGTLPAGAYTFTASSGARTLAVLQIKVTRDGLSPETPTTAPIE